MKTLVCNTGSSSLKFKLIESEGERTLAGGIVERIGLDDPRLLYVFGDGETVSIELGPTTHDDAVSLVLQALTEHDGAPLNSTDEIDAIGHRIAHAGEAYGCSVPIDDKVLATIDACAYLAPLHNPHALRVIERCKTLLGDVLQVAAFDTAFHQTMPPRNYVYPIPYRYFEKYRIRRFGFHGISHKYVSRRAAAYLGVSPRDLKMITCHLGAGASLAAIDHGISVDTTMGYTPLDGVMMGTRSGSVDPAMITAIMEKENLTPTQMDAILNRESGLLGVSGVSSDLRELKEVIKVGDERAAQAELAYDIFLNSVRRQIGAYFFELSGVDCIVCTAGIGENDPYARRLIFRGLEPFGLQIDHARNERMVKEDRLISTDESTVDLLVIPTDEEAEIAHDVALIAAGVDISDPWAITD